MLNGHLVEQQKRDFISVWMVVETDFCYVYKTSQDEKRVEEMHLFQFIRPLRRKR